jgi:uncharacterized protein YndB with AHSA1/START domain
MEKQAVVHNTFVIERGYPVTPEKVFAAFADANKKRIWYLDGGSHEIQHYEMDFRTGGKEDSRIRFGPGIPVAGMICENETVYHYIVPNQRIVFSSSMTIGGRCISVVLATIELLKTDKGTDLLFTHQGAFFEGSDGPAMREDGWHKLLAKLGESLQRANAEKA